MPLLDLQTLVVVLVSLCLAIGAPLASISGPRRGTGTLWYWALTLLALACASVLLVLRGTIPPVISIIFGNALIICAIALLGETAAALSGQFLDGSNRRFFALLTGPALGLMYIAVDAIWPRVAYMALVELYLVGQLSWQLFRARAKEALPRQLPQLAFEIMLWLYLAATLARVIGVFWIRSEEPFHRQVLVSGAFLFAILAIAIVTCVLVWHELDEKDRAIRFARAEDIASGLPNRAVFLQMLEGRLESIAPAGVGCVALLRLDPGPQGGRLDPYEEAMIYRIAGARIEALLRPLAALARVADNEFGVLFRDDDEGTAVSALRQVLDALGSRPLVADRGEYMMRGVAAVMSPGSSPGTTAAETIRLLREELRDAKAGEIRVRFTQAVPS